MNQILLTILNYVWVFIKLLLFSAVVSLPFVGITYLFQKPFDWLRTKKKLSFALSLAIIIFAISYVILIFVYFLPILDKFATFTFFQAIAFVFVQIVRLLLINLLFTGMLFIIAMFIALLYDSFVNKKKKKTKVKTKAKVTLSFFKLWKGFSIVFFVVFLFILVIFPKLIAIILYLIFM